jgi:hypothetical protein
MLRIRQGTIWLHEYSIGKGGMSTKKKSLGLQPDLIFFGGCPKIIARRALGRGCEFNKGEKTWER